MVRVRKLLLVSLATCLLQAGFPVSHMRGGVSIIPVRSLIVFYSKDGGHPVYYRGPFVIDAVMPGFILFHDYALPANRFALYGQFTYQPIVVPQSVPSYILKYPKQS